MSSAPVLLQLSGVRKAFDSEGVQPVEVLRGLDLAVDQGETLGVIGPSGSGKSTLLNLIGTLDRPDAGTVVLDGDDLGRLDERQLADVRNRKIGFVFQAHHLLPQCTVLENVLVPTLACHDEVRREQAPERARRLLERVALEDRLSHRPGQLSGGERQRVAVVRALINSPKLLLADEPTGALDRGSAENLGQLLVELNREENVTLIVVTHSVALVRRMHRVMELCDGRLAPFDGGKSGAPAVPE